jgi:glycosyltransferase involved in cell wall biosynthesis
MKNLEKKQGSREIKVYILASPHPQFDEILDFPPEGVQYIVKRVKTAYHGWFTENKIRLHNFLLSFLPIPRMARIKTDADIIHSTRGIIQLAPEKPWIVDLESGSIFTSFNYKAMRNPLVKRIIISALTSDKCKKILPQSEAARKDLEFALGKDYEKIKEKVEVLYLAMRPCEKKRINRKDKKVIISFIGWGFYPKGGQDLIRAYEILTKKYKDLELRIKSDVPEGYKALNLPGLKIIQGHLSRDELFDKMYLSTDIFVLPTHSDHYGVVFLEAMSAGLPIIGTRSFTVPELIEDGKNGFLIDTKYSWENYFTNRGDLDTDKFVKDVTKEHPEIIKQLVDKISILIESKKLREKMGKESKRIIDSGKLSIKERNKKLRKIYDDILNSAEMQ